MGRRAARDVLAVAEPAARGAHVALIGLDETERHGQRFAFGGSIPLDKALRSEVLLAYEMNGAAAAAGARRSAARRGAGLDRRAQRQVAHPDQPADEPSENYFQSKAYRLFPPSVGPENVDWDTGLMLGEMQRQLGDQLARRGRDAWRAGRVAVRGWAFAGERRVERVDLSIDGGRTWIAATSSPSARAGPGAAGTRRRTAPGRASSSAAPGTRRPDPARAPRAGLELQRLHEQRLAPACGQRGVSASAR